MTTMRGVWIVGVVVFAVATAGVAAASEPPQAEAGLDQEAVVNQTVYLDGGGSLDPDGEIVDYDWSIETPGGNTTAPDCPSCALTHFVPREDGTYAVTVTVTDDDGVSMDDTLYVRVQTSASSSSSSSGGGVNGPTSSPDFGVFSDSNNGGSGYGGGGENVRAMYNYESGNFMIQGYKGGAITLGGVDSSNYRDPSSGDPVNAWMTADDVKQLQQKDFVETHTTDGKGKVIKITDSEKAKQLKQTLEEGTEAKYTDSTVHYGADQTASGTVDEIAGDESGDGTGNQEDPSGDCGIACDISGGDDTSSGDGSAGSTDTSGSNDGGSSGDDYSNIDVGYGGGGGDSGGSSSDGSSGGSSGGSDGGDYTNVDVGFGGGGSDSGGSSSGGSTGDSSGGSGGSVGSSGSSGGSPAAGNPTLSCIEDPNCNISIF